MKPFATANAFRQKIFIFISTFNFLCYWVGNGINMDFFFFLFHIISCADCSKFSFPFVELRFQKAFTI